MVCFLSLLLLHLFTESGLPQGTTSVFSSGGFDVRNRG